VGLLVSLALALTVAVTAGTVSPASASTYPITWTADPAPFPPDALAGSGGNLTGLSCPAVGWCVSIGGYDSRSPTSAISEGMIVVESSGGFTSVQAPLPANASTTDAAVYLNDVSCGAVGSCVVVGYYRGQDQLLHSLLLTLAAGTWSASEAPMLPNDGAELSYVVCLSTNSCVASGTYTDSLTSNYYSDTSGTNYPVVETETGGSWSATEPSVTALPWEVPSLWGAPAVACSTTAYCVVAGDGYADTLSSGVWSLSSTGVDATSASCGAPGDCAVVGGAWPTVGSVATVSGGVWTTVATPLPADAVSPPAATVLSVSCAAGGSCVAVGYYEPQPSATPVSSSFIDTFAGGTWS